MLKYICIPTYIHTYMHTYIRMIRCACMYTCAFICLPIYVCIYALIGPPCGRYGSLGRRASVLQVHRAGLPNGIYLCRGLPRFVSPCFFCRCVFASLSVTLCRSYCCLSPISSRPLGIKRVYSHAQCSRLHCAAHVYARVRVCMAQEHTDRESVVRFPRA